MLVFGLGVLGALGKALLGKGRYQRAADLAAVSAARSMRDDFTRLFEPALDERGQPNPRHLEKGEYLARARGTAVEIAGLNGADARRGRGRVPRRGSFAPLRVRVRCGAAVSIRPTQAPRERIADTRTGGGGADAAGIGGRSPAWKPPVAATPARSPIDRASRCAPTSRWRSTGWPRPLARDGVSLIVTSGYRSDAEQAELYARHPDPKWVAPPGKSLHRLGTELDLGPPSAYGWLARNARRFHFVQRYSWEPWHYGYTSTRARPRSLPAPPPAMAAARSRHSSPLGSRSRSRERRAAGTSRPRCSRRSYM